MKVCTKCGQEKELEEFSRQKNGKFGRSSVCKICRKIEGQEKRKNPPKEHIPDPFGKKYCNLCKTEKEYSEFSKYKHSLDGHKSNCKSCLSKSAKVYYELNKEDRSKYRKQYYQDNKEKILKQTKDYYKENKQHLIKKSRVWRGNNKDKCNFTYAKRRTSKLNATPNWADLSKIKVIYEKAQWLGELTGLVYHVDHVIPLQGENVCGLHIWENLQVLEASLNMSKGNKHD